MTLTVPDGLSSPGIGIIFLFIFLWFFSYTLILFLREKRIQKKRLQIKKEIEAGLRKEKFSKGKIAEEREDSLCVSRAKEQARLDMDLFRHR